MKRKNQKINYSARFADPMLLNGDNQQRVLTGPCSSEYQKNEQKLQEARK